jgi:uncharacterized membrane protein
MGQAMLNAFIWPYAQWPTLKFYGLEMIQPLMKLIS